MSGRKRKRNGRQRKGRANARRRLRRQRKRKPFAKLRLGQFNYTQLTSKKQTNRIHKMPFLGSFPPRVLVPMRYIHEVTCVGTIASASPFYTFRLNSVYDPQASVGGSTVAGWGQYAAIWQKYRVHATNIKVTADIRDTSNSTTKALNTMIYAFVSDWESAGPSYGGYDSELGMQSFKQLYLPRGSTLGAVYSIYDKKVTRGVTGTGLAISGGATRNQKGSGEPFQYFRRQVFKPTAIAGSVIDFDAGLYPKYGVHSLAALNTKNPDDTYYMEIGVIPLPDTDGNQIPAPATYFQITLDMEVEWFAPIEVAAPTTITGAGDTGASENELAPTGPADIFSHTGSYASGLTGPQQL